MASVERLVREGSALRFESAGTLRFPRRAPRAAALPDGTILVAFGDGDHVAGAASAEIFDPEKGVSSATDSPGPSRAGAALVTLAGPCGVLAVGGLASSHTRGVFSVQPFADVSRFDPETRRWQEERPIPTARHGTAVVALPDGSVLVTGGQRHDGTTTNLVERRLPSGEWRTENPMEQARAKHSATLLADGRVLVVGGTSPRSLGETSSEVFDPQDGSWTSCAPMVGGEHGHGATLLPDGRVLLVGEHGLARVWSPSRMTWMAAGALRDARFEHAVIPWEEGVMLVGGNASAFYPAEPLDACVRWTPNRMPLPAEGPEPLPACPSCEGALDGERIAKQTWDDEGKRWSLSLSCGRCLSVVRFAWPDPARAAVDVEVNGAFVARLRERLAAAAAEGRVTAYREVMKVFREPAGWLLAVPEVFAAARTGLVPMMLSVGCGPARPGDPAPFPAAPTVLRANREGFPRGARFRVIGARNHQFLVVPESAPGGAPFLCSLDELLPAERVV